jgi:hypothetical protein
VLVDPIETLNHDLVVLSVYRQNNSTLALVLAGYHFYEILLFNQHRYTTSLANETIFVKLFSRNSRATAPKIRVPRGLLSLSTKTTALLSNRT